MKIVEVDKNKSNCSKIRSEEDIKKIAEIPLVPALMELYRKNILTIMSSANRDNVSWLDENGNDMYETKKDHFAEIFSYGNGYAWIMLDYDSLTDDNKTIIDTLYDELNEDEQEVPYFQPITKDQTYQGRKKVIYAIHQSEFAGRPYEIDTVKTFESLTSKPNPSDKFESNFFEKSDFVYTTPYVERTIILRYPVTEETTVEEVEEYFSSITSRLKGQEKYFSTEDIVNYLRLDLKNDMSIIDEIARNLGTTNGWKQKNNPYARGKLYTKDEAETIIQEYRRRERERKEYAISKIIESIPADASKEEKYKSIFDWFVNNCRYDYSTLYLTEAYNIGIEAAKKYRKIILEANRQFMPKENETAEKIEQERVEFLLKFLKENPDSPEELISLKTQEKKLREMAVDFRKDFRKYRRGNIFITKLGVCEDFAAAYKELCSRLGLQCEMIIGNILSGDVECGHAWNAIVINGEAKHVDVSSAIHCQDGTTKDNVPNDFFNVSYSQLMQLDNGKNRTMTPESTQKIGSMVGVGFDD